MKYFCSYCSYSYDEAFGDEIEGVEAGTRVEEMHICPSCGEQDSLIYVKEEVHYVDKNTRDIKELEHFIELERVDINKVKIIIGEGEHPMDETHSICATYIVDEYGDVVEEKFVEDEEISEVIIPDYDLEDFEVRIKCSKHGVFARKFESFEKIG